MKKLCPNSTGFWTLFRRESLRFLVVPNQTLLPSVVSLLLFIVVFGFFLGNNVREIGGQTYIVFIFPGLLLMGVVTSAFQNASVSLFISKWERFVEDLLVAPISFAEMVGALVLASIVRGVLTGLLALMIGLVLIPTPFTHPGLLLMILVLSSVVFASFGLIVGLWAQRWDNIAVFQTYVVTPLVFLGGVFYSTQNLPPNFRWVNELNPLYYMVSGTRFAFLGRSDESFLYCLAVTGSLALFFLAAAVELFRRGYRLRT